MPQSPQWSLPSLNPPAIHCSLGRSQDTYSSSVPGVNVLHSGTGGDPKFSGYFLTLLWTTRGFFTLPTRQEPHATAPAYRGICMLGRNGCHSCWQSLIWWLKISELSLPQACQGSTLQLCLWTATLSVDSNSVLAQQNNMFYCHHVWQFCACTQKAVSQCLWRCSLVNGTKLKLSSRNRSTKIPWQIRKGNFTSSTLLLHFS